MAEVHRNPTPTVDIIIEVDGRIVLIERENPPHGWALPGGFVDEGETVERAAIREAAEETQLDVELQDLLYVYSHPERDPRGHTMSTVFVATAEGKPRGADDAARARLFSPSEVPANLAFDHETILEDYLKFRSRGVHPSPALKLEQFEREGGER